MRMLFDVKEETSPNSGDLYKERKIKKNKEAAFKNKKKGTKNLTSTCD